LAPVARIAGPRPIGVRAVFDGKASRAVEIPVYARAQMQPGAAITGPALVVEDGTSTFVSASFDATLDAGLGLVLVAKE
jgi:N-methylhydantoinase A